MSRSKLNIKISKAIQNLILKDWKLFGIVNALFAFGIGLYGYSISFALAHFHFYLTAPLFTYFILGTAWRLTFQNKTDFQFIYLLIMVLFLVPLIHYLSYLSLISLNLVLDFWNSADNNLLLFEGSWLYFLLIAFPFAYMSIYQLYFITVIIPVIIGVWVNRRKRIIFY